MKFIFSKIIQRVFNYTDKKEKELLEKGILKKEKEQNAKKTTEQESSADKSAVNNAFLKAQDKDIINKIAQSNKEKKEKQSQELKEKKQEFFANSLKKLTDEELLAKFNEIPVENEHLKKPYRAEFKRRQELRENAENEKKKNDEFAKKGVLPKLPENQIANANELIRSNLFLPKKRGFKFVDEKVLYTDGNVKILFSGPELSTRDEHIFNGALKLAQNEINLFGESIWSTYEILKICDLPTTRTQYYNLVDESFRKLTKATITLETPEKEFHGHLIDYAEKHRATKRWTVRFNREILKMLRTKYTIFDLKESRQLLENPMVYKLFKYFFSLPDTTKNEPIKRNLDTLYKICGVEIAFKIFKKRTIQEFLPAVKDAFEKRGGGFDFEPKENKRAAKQIVVWKTNKIADEIINDDNEQSLIE